MPQSIGLIMMMIMFICGVDEAGRGPIAGPVTAGAVILTPGFPVGILNDSKALKPGQRREIAALIRSRALAWTTGWAWPREIEQLNIHQAALIAMARAVTALPILPEQVLVDGLFTPQLTIPCRAIVKGDQKIPEIMAASIIAKTERDRWMVHYSRIDPRYCFEKHKGYPTREHRRLVQHFGLSLIHRKSFKISFP